MKVIKTTVDDAETSVDIDLFEGRKLPLAVRQRVSDEVGNFLVEQTLISLDQKKSPVQGEGSFKPLSPLYKKKKQNEVGNTDANLEFDGLMKDSLDFVPTKSGVRIGVYGERAPAADGHNNLSGNSNLPTRRFLPKEGQQYKANIEREVERIIADAIAEETTFKKSEFKNITSKKELYEKLAQTFGGTRAEIALAVFRNEALVDLLGELDLVKLL